MAAPSNAITLYGQYVAARLAAMGLTMFDVGVNLRTAAGIGRLMHRLDKRHADRAREHLRIAFPEWSDERVEATLRESFEHFVQLVIEVLYTPRMISRGNWADRVQPKNLSRAVSLLSANQPLLMLTGHVGNWEVLGYFLAVLGFNIEALARPIDNPLVNDWLLGIRQRQGLRIITKFNATDQMMRVLDSGGALGFIADQNAGDKGIFVPFFGKLASTYKSIGLLAIERNIPVVCGYAHRLDGQFKYEVGVVDVIEPEQWADRPDPLYYITARYMRAIEQMVRLRPAQYLWMHRRWKSRPRHERLGKPMPRKLRENIESLDWLSDAERQRLLADTPGPGGEGPGERPG